MPSIPWVIADTHLGHKKIIEMNHRPADFESKTLDNLSLIGKDDILYHLGDICLYKIKYLNELFLEKSPAKKNILVLGNHDNQTVSWYYKVGWDFVCTSATVRMFGKDILFTHIPIAGIELCKMPVNTINVHGHIHTSDYRKDLIEGRHFNMVMEHTYKPVQLRKLIGL